MFAIERFGAEPSPSSDKPSASTKAKLEAYLQARRNKHGGLKRPRPPEGGEREEERPPAPPVPPPPPAAATTTTPSPGKKAKKAKSPKPHRHHDGQEETERREEVVEMRREKANKKNKKKEKKHRLKQEVQEKEATKSLASGEKARRSHGGEEWEEEEEEEEEEKKRGGQDDTLPPSSTSKAPPAPATSGLDMVRRLLQGYSGGRAPQPSSGRQGGPHGDSDDEDGVMMEAEGEGAERKDEEEEAVALASQWGLDARLVPHLTKQGVVTFFKVQRRVMPYLLSGRWEFQERDVVVTAPTGSGKTLVYVLTVLQALSRVRVHRLRALVVLPNRDLATQVFEEFIKYSPAVHVHVCLVMGQSDFTKEQATLLDPLHPVDVLVATPGRLMDHLERTGPKGFSLEHIRLLVIDEVDRLVNQSYQEWLTRVHDAINNPPHTAPSASTFPSSSGLTPFTLTPAHVPAYHLSIRTSRRPPSTNPYDHDQGPGTGGVLPPPPLRQLLFSATFTTNPQKLAHLHLRNPRYISLGGGARAHKDKEATTNATKKEEEEEEEEEEDQGEGKAGTNGHGRAYTTPETLSEYSVTITDAQHKPLALLALLHQLLSPPSSSLVLIFTSSVDSTHRLCRLLQLIFHSQPLHEEVDGGGVGEFSSTLSQAQRSSLMASCKSGAVRVLVSSDGMARGIDLPNVIAVINYDTPSRAKTYVHRVGRTARAGREGSSYTLIKRGQEAAFKRMRGAIGGAQGGVRGVTVGVKEWGQWVGAYRKALLDLKTVLEEEKAGRRRVNEPLAPRR